MHLYLLIKTLHILSSTILFGTGIGIAFFMFRSLSSDDLQTKFYAAKNTVLADTIFTLPAILIQPLSGAWLIWYTGYPWTSSWLLVTYILYITAGACWLVVAWIQLQLRKMLAVSLKNGEPLPPRYLHLCKLWFLLGWPAFAALVAIFYLMVAKPALF